MAFDQQYSLCDISGSTSPNKLKFVIIVQDLREDLHLKFQPFLRRRVK